MLQFNSSASTLEKHSNVTDFFCCLNLKTLDVKVLILIVESMQPQDGELDQGKHTSWLKRVKAAKPIIDNVIESVVVGKTDAYVDLTSDFDETR